MSPGLQMNDDLAQKASRYSGVGGLLDPTSDEKKELDVKLSSSKELAKLSTSSKLLQLKKK